MFRLFRLEDGGGLRELEGVKLKIEKLKIDKVRESMIYALLLGTRWQVFFEQELEVAMKAAERVRELLSVKDRFPYMLGWVNSDCSDR